MFRVTRYFSNGSIGGGGAPMKRPNGSDMIGKPHGGTMRLVDPLLVLGDNESKLLSMKLSAVKSAANLKLLDPSEATKIRSFMKTVFPDHGFILLSRQAGNYSVMVTGDIDIDPALLDLSGPQSIIRAACEALPPMERRTIYVPDTSKNLLFLESKSNFADREANEFTLGKHLIEEGTINDSGLKIDLASFKLKGIRAVAVEHVQQA